MTSIGTLCIRRGITLVTEEPTASGYRQAAGLGYHKGCTTILIPQGMYYYLDPTGKLDIKNKLDTKSELDEIQSVYQNQIGCDHNMFTTILIIQITFLSENINPSDSVTIIHNACC